MDFVVVGLGLGALGVLLGVVMLGWLAPRAQRAGARTAPSENAARDVAIAAEHRVTGQAFLYAGTAMLLATIGGLAGSLDDRTGALLVTTTATVAAIGILLAGYLHRARHPVPRRYRPVPAAESSPRADVPLLTPPIVLTDAVPGSAEAESVSTGDDGDARAGPSPVTGAVLQDVTGDAAPISRSDSGSALGEVEAGSMGDVTVAALSNPESDSAPDPPVDHQSDDATSVEEEETVVVGFVVPADRPDDGLSASPRGNEGEDPS